MSNKIELTGKLIRKGEIQAIGNSQKRTFAIEVDDGRYTNPYEFELFGDKVDLVAKMRRDEIIAVVGYVQCRWWDGNSSKPGRYFTSLNATSVTGTGSQASQPHASPAPAAQPKPPAPKPAPVYADDDGSDIPF